MNGSPSRRFAANREPDRRTTALERSEEHLRQAQALAEVGSFELDLETGAIEWSEELYRLNGRDPATFRPTYETFLASIPGPDRHAVEDALRLTTELGTPFNLEHHVVRADGTTRVVQSIGQAKLGQDGRVKRVIGSCQDITEHRRIEIERELLADIVDCSQDAIIRIAPDGVVETYNPAAEQLFGYAAREVVGKHVQRLIPPERVADFEDAVKQLRGGQRAQRFDVIHYRRDGSSFFGSCTLSAITDKHGQIIGFSNVVRDTSEQHLARELLEQSLHDKEELLREVHHRVKNNLQLISSLLNMQLTSIDSEEARRGLIESQSRIHSMALVHQLLYQSTSFAHVDLASYLGSLVDYVRRTYEAVAGRIAVTLDVPHLELDIDRAIPCGLIVNELVTNAFRHAFPGDREGHVEIDATEETRRLSLEVRDDGVGMSAQFDIDRAVTFGLQIARSLAAQLDGTLERVSHDPGTILRVTFPLTASGPR